MSSEASQTAQSHKPGLATSSSSTVGDEQTESSQNVDVEAQKRPIKDEEKDQDDSTATEKDTAANTSETVEAPFPEGGFDAWAGVASTALVMAFSFGYLNAYGVFQEFYGNPTSGFLHDYSQSDIAWIGALQYFFIFAVGLFAGRAFDLGLFRPLMAFAILLMTFSQMMLSLCKTYYQIILAQGVGLGLSMGLLFNLAVNVPSHWFKKRRAFALGIQSTGSSIGGVIFPIMIKKLLVEIGYGWTMRLIGFGCLILLGGSFYFMKTRLPPIVNILNGGWRKVTWFDPSAFKQSSYTLFVIGCTFVLFGLYTPFVYISTFTSQYHIPADGYWLSVMNAASVFGRVIPGIIADRYGRINTVVPHTSLAAIILFIFPLFTNLSLIVFVLIYGYCSGCFVSLIAPSVAQLGPTNTVGTRLGMMFFVMSIGGLLGTPISGFILGSTPPLRWWATIGYSASLVVVGVIFCTAARYCALDGKFRGKI